MTASPATLLALASEVEAGEGPDREMDARVWVALHEGLSVVKAWYGPAYVKGPDESTNVPEPLTASVDAALVLLADVLPGYVCTSSTYGFASKMPIADVYREGHEGRAQSKAPTVPRAIVAAVLKAAATITPQEK